MNKLLILLTLLISNFLNAQPSVMKKISNKICDTLKHFEKPIDSLTLDHAISITRYISAPYLDEWNKELKNFKSKTGKKEYYYNLYYLHILQLECKEFRSIGKKIDTYLINKNDLRPLYIVAKEFVFSLQDNDENNKLMQMLDDSLKTKKTLKLLNQSKQQINDCKRTSPPNIMLIYTDGYTFRVRYFDYLTNDPGFQIDLNFKDNSDFKIDKLVITNKDVLMKELNERIEYNKKVESGEIPEPKPPPPPPIDKNE